MVVFLRVAVLDIGGEEAFGADLVLIDLFAFQNKFCFGKAGGPVFKNGGQAGGFDFVQIAAGLASAELQSGAHGFLKEGEGEFVGAVDEFFGVALGADIDSDDVFIPHNAHVSPADGHGIEAGLVTGSEKRPVFSDEGERIERKGGGVDGVKHNESSFKS